MNDAIKTTIDAAGRLVVPKPIREQAGIGPGDTLTVAYRDGRIEIEPAPRAVRIEEREGFRIAEPADSYETLSEDTVRRTREEVRAVRKGRKARR
jgi:AbrB family looped-hinge helix DNA binding protein